MTVLLVLGACGRDDEFLPDTAWFQSSAWEDGKAVICVYRGRLRRYGAWRKAEVKDYLIREYLDRRELTKRGRNHPGLLPVIKVNRHVTFTTGTYDYRLMYSLFFERETGRLAKAVGSSQEGCGLTFQRWDERDRRLRFDSYWEGEGAGTRALPKRGYRFFADEVPYVVATLRAGAQILVYPSLLRSNLKGWKGEPRTVRREGRAVTLIDASGEPTARYVYDEEGFLESWRVHGEEFAQEFERVAFKRLYYWQFTRPGDEKMLVPR